MKKRELRTKMKKLQGSMSSDSVKKLSEKIIVRSLKLQEVKNARSFFIYVSVKSEVQTHKLIEKLLKQGKIITVPKILEKGIMQACQIASFDGLKSGKYDIPCPASKNFYKGKIDVGVVPGLAFTTELERLGKGGGYYDKFIAENSEIFTIGLAFESQIVPYIPTIKDDQLVDMVVTERRVIN